MSRYMCLAYPDVTTGEAMAKRYGYARVSTGEQDLTLQKEALIAADVNPDLIFSEKVTGTKRDGREKLDLLLKIADQGDTIIITRIDRLARSMRDLQNIVHELRAEGRRAESDRAAG